MQVTINLGLALCKTGWIPVAFFSEKLTGTQMNYTTMEKELLSIVAMLKKSALCIGSQNEHFY